MPTPLTRFMKSIGQAREQGPFALGPQGPEVLTYDLVRERCCATPVSPCRGGLALAVQGITSGPVWDRVCRLIISLDGAAHHRLRRLVSRAFTPSAAERTATNLRRRHHRTDRQRIATRVAATSSPTSPAPTRCPSSVHCLAAPRTDSQLFSRLGRPHRPRVRR